MTEKNTQDERKTVLVVDDSFIVRRMICFALQGLNHGILEASDGSEAVRVVCGQPIDLLITAMNLPSLNGLDLSQIVRDTSGLEDIPIIMLTQEDSLVDKDEARKVGISILISKPFNHAQIYHLVKEVLT